jgi:alcohol dehydrogenase class IV
MTTFVESSNFPLCGLWQPQFQLKHLHYGPSCVKKHLLSTLPSESSKVFIITGNSIATKTPLLQKLQTILGNHHAGSFSSIRQHAPVADIDQATDMIADDPSIDTILSLGGGSPIDSAKTISFRMNEKTGKFLTHLSIPTTLSAAECTMGGGYTKADGVKTSVMAPEVGLTAIFYDPTYAKYTPTRLWLATGMRAMDHAVESQYQPYATEMPWRALSIWAVQTFFENLPKAKVSHPDDDDVTTRLLLASFASLGFRGKNVKGGMGLSHSLGNSLGSPYGIPRKFSQSLRYQQRAGHTLSRQSILCHSEPAMAISTPQTPPP